MSEDERLQLMDVLVQFEEGTITHDELINTFVALMLEWGYCTLAKETDDATPNTE
jgi:hypothetical protein